MTRRGGVHRRDFLRAAQPRRVLELSCERLFMKYEDARAEGRLPQFIEDLRHEIAAAAEVRLTGTEWLTRDDFGAALGDLLES
ncbi:MAG TPA: hypothetical protein VM364_20790 [Vicinamibacterales bacterium]|nr:hypothetical protein [Vicinamibacterales bacterium]